MEILIAFFVVIAIAFIAGILLLVFSHLFFVEKNPLEKAVRECLPGINCGACGYSGCDDYAASLAKGKAKPNLCIPAGKKASDSISDILGIAPEETVDITAFVACNGDCMAVQKLAEYKGVETCRGASMVYGGTNSCRFGCLGFGDCERVCPSGAISLNNGIAKVVTSRCIGCGLCSGECPKGIIRMIPERKNTVVMCSNKQKGTYALKACKNACIGCKKCERACPCNAVKVVDNLAVIDYETCKNCGKCAEICPTGCINKDVFFNCEILF